MPGELWVSAAGLQTYSRTVDTLAQDIANVNTDGFKAILPSAASTPPAAVYPAGLAGPGAGPAAPPQVLAGGGAAPSLTEVDWSQGGVAPTGRPLDLAILGPGLFVLRGAGGATAYTRAGRFELDAAGHITDAAGHLLLDVQGRALTLPSGAHNPHVQADGTLTATVPGSATPVVVGRIALAFPTAPQGMRAGPAGDWTAGAAAGPIATAPPDGRRTRLQSGALEQSNTDLAAILPAMLEAERAYQANSRAVGVSLQLWSMSNQLRG